MQSIRSVPKRFIVISLLLIHVGLLAWSAYCHSPTRNEPAHLVAGISHWEFNRFELYRVNPPLVRMLAALPVMIAGYDFEWGGFYEHPGARAAFGMGRAFSKANGERILWLMTIARWACIPFSLIGAFFCYLWAKELYGDYASLLALTLWCFSPNILAHGPLITSDLAGTSLGVVACYSFWKWLQKPTWTKMLISSFALGIAELAKSTLVIFYPLWPVIWLVYRLPQWKEMTLRIWGRELVMLFARMLIGVCVINLGYGFEDAFQPLESFEFVSEMLGTEEATEVVGMSGNRFRGTWLGEIPVPFPANYIRGIDIQRREFEKFGRLSYLRGEFRLGGWWYYYLYGMAIKVPLGTWLLLLPAILSRFKKTEASIPWTYEFVLLSPFFVILIFVSSQTGFSHHFRYVLPIFPYAFIWLSQAANHPSLVIRSLTVFAIIWSVGSSLWVYPHSLSYFNELAGGPEGGHNHMIVSNIDWGQDLIFLKQWMDDHPEAKPLNLIYYGDLRPDNIGINFEFPEFADRSGHGAQSQLVLKPGWYAVSVNFLRGYPWQVSDGKGGVYTVPKNSCIDLLKQKPVAKAGWSIYIYHITE